MKSVFEYKNYREFIHDYYVHSKTMNKKFSHRLFARLAGFKSSNFIKLIIDNKSNVSEESAASLALAMKLKKEEALFFQTLVRFNQAASSEERHQHAESLLRFRTIREMFPLKELIFNYAAKWYLSLLRGVVGLPTFREDSKWLSEKIKPEISVAEIKNSFEDLIKLGLLKRDENGKLIQTAANVASDDEVTASSAAHFHREMMKRASESIDLIPREKRDISGLTIGISEEMAKRVKERVQEFRKELVSLVSQDENANAVYQFNIQFFPLIEIEKPEDREGS